MAILTDDYIIIIITCEKSTETSLRKRLNKGIQINNWCYAAIKNDNESKIIKSNDKQCNAEAKEVQGYQFFLIYAGCFKTEGDHQQCNGKIRKLINAIKSFNNSNYFTDIVITANDCIKEILKGKEWTR